MSGPERRVAVIGAGLAGLAAARDLVRAGRPVTVLDDAHEPGGLASSVDLGGLRVERFYHFVCRGDTDLVALVDELGLSGRLHWRPTGTAFFHDGHMYPFSSPGDLLRFSPVPLLQRLRFGLNVVSSRSRRRWRRLDRLSARDWLTRQIGERAYQVIWDPLLRIKFGEAHDRVSAAWIWHRIHRVATSRRRVWQREHLGYLEQGSATVVDALVAELREHPLAVLRSGVRVAEVVVEGDAVRGLRVAGEDRVLPCAAVVSTVPLPLLASLVPALDGAYRSRLLEVEYLGVACGLLRLRRPVTSSFWVNINDRRTPLNGVIEYTNLNRHLDAGGSAIVYLPQYLATTSPRFALDDRELLGEYLACLRLLNPSFDPGWVEEARVFRTTHAQAICPVGFAERVPGHRAPVAGLYLTDSTQFYPEDRTLSAAVRLGRRVASMVLEDQSAGVPGRARPGTD